MRNSCGKTGSYADADALARSLGVKICENVPAEKLSTFRGGGTAARVYAPVSAESAAAFLRGLPPEPGEPFILGGGSDTVIADGTVMRPVVYTGLMRVAEMRGGRLYADCGVGISSVIAAARREGLGGAEFLAGVPASVGGALRMNAGAFGEEIGGLTDEILCLNRDTGEMYSVKASDAGFGYRRGVQDMVVGVYFALPRMSAEESAARARGFIAQRRLKQPSFPSCGSVFRAADRPAGYYIERAGLKGARHGGAEISRVHANFIVNNGGASAGDYLALAELAERAVEDTFGIKLEREFVLLD